MAATKLIPWEYCECGCKSYECRIAGHAFSLFWDLKDGWYLEYPDFSRKKFNSQEAADDAVLDFLEEKKEELIKTRKDITRVLKALKERANA